ncbi:MAG TPA: hypothetical protein VI873_02640 [Candidatus Peribacteraceae bacterium]|nr:hypothetical protein [Candidatus Peribacteraceae bacterium]
MDNTELQQIEITKVEKLLESIALLRHKTSDDLRDVLTKAREMLLREPLDFVTLSMIAATLLVSESSITNIKDKVEKSN